MMPAPPGDDDDIESGASRLDVDLLAVPMDHWYEPFLPADHLGKLPQQMVVPLEYLAESVHGLVQAEDVVLELVGVVVLSLALEELHGVPGHVARQGVRHVVGVRVVAVLQLVGLEQGVVLLLVRAGVVAPRLEQRHDTDLLNEVDFVSWVKSSVLPILAILSLSWI